jgi:hypothetical protein
MRADFGRWLGGERNSDVGLSAGLGYRLWRRDIQSVGSINGLDERYSWNYLHGSILLRHRRSKEQNLLFKLQALQAFNSNMVVKFKNQPYDTVNLELLNTPSLRLSVSWQKTINHRTTLIVAGMFEYWLIKESDAKPLTIQGTPTAFSTYEPESITFDTMLTVGLRKSLFN